MQLKRRRMLICVSSFVRMSPQQRGGCSQTSSLQRDEEAVSIDGRFVPQSQSFFAWSGNIPPFSPTSLDIQAESNVEKWQNGVPRTCPGEIPCLHCRRHADMTLSNIFFAKGIPLAPLAVREAVV